MTLITKHSYEISKEQSELVKKAIDYKQASLSPNTWRTYLSMWNKFLKWCVSQKVSSLPAKAETIALYLTDIGEEVSFSTLDSTIAAIEKAHKEKGSSIKGNPQDYREIRRGIRRTHTKKLQIKQAPALSVVDLKVALKSFTDSLQDVRNKALITLGYWGAFRRSELVSIQYNTLSFTDEGVIVSLLGSKTSDKLEEIYVSNTQDPLVCPVRALKQWITLANIDEGTVFRSLIKGGGVSENKLSAHSVSHIMKKIFGKEYSGHSLRRGVITEVAKQGVPIHEIQKFSRHRSVDMVIRYAEKAKGFESTSAKALGV